MWYGADAVQVRYKFVAKIHLYHTSPPLRPSCFQLKVDILQLTNAAKQPVSPRDFKAAMRRCVLLLGNTGAGKSHVGNHLIARSAERFAESSGPESETTRNVKRPSKFAPSSVDVADSPGTLDSKGRDTTIAVELVDFLENQEILVVLYIFAGRLTQHDRLVIQWLKDLGLKHNLLLVKNMCPPSQKETGAIEAVPVVNVNMGQTEFSLLTALIHGFTSISLRNVQSPPWVFSPSSPDSRETDVKEFTKTTTLPVKVKKEKKRTVTWRECVRPPSFFHHSRWETRSQIVTDFEEVVEQRRAEEYAHFRLVFAQRLDGTQGIRSKTYLRTSHEFTANE